MTKIGGRRLVARTFRRSGVFRRLASAAVVFSTAACVTPPDNAPPPEPSRVQPQATSRVLELAERAVEEQRYQDAQQLLERVLAQDPRSVRARLVRAEVLLASGHEKQALSVFEELLESEPSAKARALQGRGIARLLQRQHGLSAADLEGAAALDPGLWRTWNALGYHHDVQQNWSEAEAAYGKALNIKPDSAITFNNRGFSRLMQQRPSDAAGDFVKALRLDPRLRVAESNLRLAIAWEGHYQKAVAGVPRTDLSAALNNIGFVALLRGDLDIAERYLAQALEADAGFNSFAARNLDYLDALRQADVATRKGLR